MKLPTIGVRPRPPPTATRKPSSPAAFFTASRPMSCTSMAARSLAAPLTAILNLRGRWANSGWKVDHWRMISHHGRGSTTSSRAMPANWSVVVLRMQLPLVWIACICTVASSARISGTSSNSGQLNCTFCRVLMCA
ncbi:hypothetical protein D9M71_703160 [compost metagenome]